MDTPLSYLSPEALDSLLSVGLRIAARLQRGSRALSNLIDEYTRRYAHRWPNVC